MRKRNGGFTLIELLIAIAVLSTMAAVLLQTFVLGGRMSREARTNEVLLDLASKTMEEMKGYSFWELDQRVKKGDASSIVDIGSSSYDYEVFPGAAGGKSGKAKAAAAPEPDGGMGPANDSEISAASGPGADPAGASRLKGAPPDTEEGGETGGDETPYQAGPAEGYILMRPYGRNPKNGRAEYLIRVEADRGRYGAREEGSEGGEEDSVSGVDRNAYTINNFAMPNIADVSSYQNVVIEPGILVKSDALLVAELLGKVNKDEEKETGKDKGGEGGSSGKKNDKEEIESYTEDAIRKFLYIELSEQGSGSGEKNGRLTVSVRAVYTVDPDGPDVHGSGAPVFDKKLTIEKELYSTQKRLSIDDETGEMLNGIYVFLPDAGNIKGVISQAPDPDKKGDEDAGDIGEGQADPVRYEKVWITAGKVTTEDQFRFYLVVPPTGYEDVRDENDLVVNHGKLPGDKNTDAVDLHSNLGGGTLVSQGEPRVRLYRLTVTIHEAVYGGAADSEPEMGEELIRLESTKSEQRE